MWDLPGPGLEPVSPALAGRFSTTAPPGKPPTVFYNLITQVPFQHFCCILFVRNKLLGAAHTQQEAVTQGRERQKARVIESHFGKLSASVGQVSIWRAFVVVSFILQQQYPIWSLKSPCFEVFIGLHFLLRSICVLARWPLGIQLGCDSYCSMRETDG